MHKRVAVCIPCYTYIPSKFLNNIMQIVTEAQNGNIIVEVCIKEGLYIDRVRNELVQMALEKGSDYIFFVDNDNLTPPNALANLISDIELYQADIMAGLYFEKPKPHYPLLRKWWRGGFERIEEIKIGEIVEADGVGMGCTLIRSSLFSKIDMPYFSTSYETLFDKPVYYGEDLYFCRKIRPLKPKILCNTAIISQHIGGLVDEIDYMSHELMRTQKASIRDEYIRDVAEFTGESYDDAKMKIYISNLTTAEWNFKKPKDDEINNFYKETKNYIYDLGYQHLWSNHREFDLNLVEECKKSNPKKILDYGAGTGENSYLLAKEGFDVTVADLDSYTLNFAEYRFKKHNVPARFWRVDKETINEKFDMILCFDVLEHLMPDDLNETIEKIRNLKAEGGQVLITGDFEQNQDPMHYKIPPETFKLIEGL